ncbi:MAG: LLM class flavin-dependent oxidoreductase [Myxococcales bacterium]|nr:LLM class flavin-dependent oxidoreductase [Myxococcales bacterium]
MKIGVVLLSWNGAMNGETPTSRDVVDLALLAEETGFDSVWINDHFYFDYSDFGEVDIQFPQEMHGIKGGAWECWSLVSAIAQATTRVEIGTLISSTSFRNPALLARIADTADDLSDGRLILGLGAGDFPTEHESFGIPFDRRIARFEEAIEIVYRLIRGESVTFDGEFYRVKDVALIPKSVRPNGPPLLIGSVYGRPRMTRLTLTYGDYWNCFLAFGESTIDRYRKAWTTLVEASEKYGRDPSTIGRNVSVSVDIADTPFPIPGPTAISGTPDAIVDTLSEFASEGIEHCTIVLHPFTRDGIERLGEIAERIRDA